MHLYLLAKQIVVFCNQHSKAYQRCKGITSVENKKLEPLAQQIFNVSSLEACKNGMIIESPLNNTKQERKQKALLAIKKQKLESNRQSMMLPIFPSNYDDK